MMTNFRRLGCLLAFALVALSVQATVVAQQSPRSPGNQAPARTDGAVATVRPSAQAAPAGFQIGQREAEFIDKVLGYWHHKTNQIDRFRCMIKRWEYTQFAPKDPNTGKPVYTAYAEGELRYVKPDKAQLMLPKVLYYTPGRKENEPAAYLARPNDPGERWICDGKSIWEYDGRKKQVIERTLPPHLQGKSIGDGPLPFFFGAEPESLKRRFWFKVVTPEDAQKRGEYWLKAKPKTRRDAANYEQILIILDGKDFLQSWIQVHLPGGKERTVYEFSKRESNSIKFRVWPQFMAPNVPSGWTKVVDRGPTAPPSGRPAAASPRGGNQARRPYYAPQRDR